MTHREEKIEERIAHTAAEFFAYESNRQSLITVTRASLSPDGAKATVFISVIPQSAEPSVISFARRNRTELREFMKKHLPIGRIPTLDVLIDEGEKNRQHVDDLLRED